MIKSVISLMLLLPLTFPPVQPRVNGPASIEDLPVGRGVVAKDISLTYSLKVGDEFTLNQKTDQKVVQTIMGMNQTGNTTYEGTMDMRVASTESSRIRLESKMTHLKTHIKNFLNETMLDSDGDMSVSSNKIVRAMMNRSFFITLSKSGSIEKVENVDNLWAGLDKLDVSDDEKTKVKGAIGQLINDNSFKNGLGQAFLIYAGKPVQLKESWKTESGIPGGFPVSSDNLWMLESTTSSHAVVSGAGTFRTIDKDKVVALPGDLKAKVDLAGNQKVNGLATLKSGLPDKVTVEVQLSGKILLLAGGMLPMDVELPTVIETHIDYTFLRK